MTNRQYRHGDVFLVEANLPANARQANSPEQDIILAYGEVTGHAHRIKERSRVSLWEANGRRYVTVEGDEPVALTHEEHHTIMVPPGTYEARIQRVYTPEEIRNVQD